MSGIVIIGASGHAKVIIDIIEKQGDRKIAGVVDPQRTVGSEFCGYPVLGGDDVLAEWTARGITGGIIAIGDNARRRVVAHAISSLVPEFPFVTAIHPSATLARGVTVGAGTAIMAGAVVNIDSIIGAHCIVNTKASLDHDCAMHDFSSLAPGATTGGGVTIGRGSAISLGAAVVQGVTIGAQTVLGAGAVALRDLPDGCVAYGVPARVIRSTPDAATRITATTVRADSRRTRRP